MLIHSHVKKYLVGVPGTTGYRLRCFSTPIIMTDTEQQIPTFMEVRVSRKDADSWASIFVNVRYETAEAKDVKVPVKLFTSFLDKYLIIKCVHEDNFEP